MRCYHILYPGGSSHSSQWDRTVVERCLRNSLSQSAKLCYKYHTGCRGEERKGEEEETERKKGRFNMDASNSTPVTPLTSQRW